MAQMSTASHRSLCRLCYPDCQVRGQRCLCFSHEYVVYGRRADVFFPVRTLVVCILVIELHFVDVAMSTLASVSIVRFRVAYDRGAPISSVAGGDAPPFIHSAGSNEALQRQTARRTTGAAFNRCLHRFTLLLLLEDSVLVSYVVYLSSVSNTVEYGCMHCRISADLVLSYDIVLDIVFSHYSPLLSPMLRRCLARRMLHSSLAMFQAAASNYLRGSITALHGPPFIEISIRGTMFRVSPNSFFQTNTFGANTLTDVVATACAAAAGTDAVRL